MATISNFIPLNRKIFKHQLWLQNRTYSRFEAWLDLLATARFDTGPGKVMVNDKMITFNRGELVASVRYLMERWQWTKNKVECFLKLLKSETMITTRTADHTQKTIITICNYNTYNQITENSSRQTGHKPDSKQTAAGQQPDKTNKVNTEQKSKNREIYRAFAHLTIYYHEFLQLTTMGHSPTDIDDVLDAIENYKNNKKYTSLFFTAKKWLRGQNTVARPGGGQFQSGSGSIHPSGGRITNIANAFQQALQG